MAGLRDRQEWYLVRALWRADRGLAILWWAILVRASSCGAILRRMVSSACEKSGWASLSEMNSSPAASSMATGRSDRPDRSTPNSRDGSSTSAPSSS